MKKGFLFLAIILTLFFSFSAHAQDFILESKTEDQVALLATITPAYTVSPGVPSWTVVWDAQVLNSSTSWSFNDGVPARNYRAIVLGTETTGGGTHIRVRLKASTTDNYTLSSVTIGPKKASSDPWDFTETPTQITFNASNSVTVTAAGGDVYSDDITFTLEASTNYLVAFWDEAGVLNYLDGAVTNEYYKDTASNETMTADVASYSTYSATPYLYQIEAY